MKVIRAILTVETTDQELIEVNLSFGEIPDFEWSLPKAVNAAALWEVLAFIRRVRRTFARESKAAFHATQFKERKI